jgi:ketosteroid isomerase-like protein
MSTSDDFQQAIDEVQAALRQLVQGDPAPLLALWSHAPDVTALTGMGTNDRGWEQVGTGVQWIGDQFRDGQIDFELLASGVSGDLAYTVWFETGQARLFGREEFTPTALRITHIYRREAGAWKIIHLHASPLKPAP